MSLPLKLSFELIATSYQFPHLLMSSLKSLTSVHAMILPLKKLSSIYIEFLTQRIDKEGANFINYLRSLRIFQAGAHNVITGDSLWENVHCISILLYLIRPKKGKEQGSGGQKRSQASHIFMEEAPIMFEGIKMYRRGAEAPRVIQTPEKQCSKSGLNFSQRFLAANEPSYLLFIHFPFC